MISKPKQNSIERLGTATDGLGSERYKLVKKMVIGGMLRGSINSIRDSGLMIGTSTAKKYNSALIRDGVIPSNNKPKKHIHEEEISETQKFDDFVNFVNGIMDRKEGLSERAVLEVALAGAVSILIEKFEDHVDKIERSLIKHGRPRITFYRTGFIKNSI